MYANKGKTWIIDVDKSLPDDDVAREQLDKLARAARERLAETGAEQAYVQVGPVPDRTFLLLVAAYVLGPLAPVVMQQGRPRESVVWACLGLAALPLWLGLFLSWDSVSTWAQSGRLPFLVGFGGLGALTAFAFAAWARAVFLAGWDARFFPERLSHALTNPVLTLLAGLVAPGSGLLLQNAARRAAWALWNAGITLMAAVAVWQTRVLWKANAASTSAQLEPRTLEYVLLGALALVACGVLIWIGSALDGARCAAHRSGHRMQGRGEWLVLGVLVAWVAFVVTFQPETLARELDRSSAHMQRAGMEVLPLLGSIAATELDPTQPTYALRQAQLQENFGNTERAASLRMDLQTRWSAYQRALESDSIATQGDATDTRVPFALPSVALSGAHVSALQAWSAALRESLVQELPRVPGEKPATGAAPAKEPAAPAASESPAQATDATSS